MKIVCGCAAIVCLMIVASECQAETIFKDPKGTFEWTVPDGFAPFLGKNAWSTGILCMYARQADRRGNSFATLSIYELSSTIAQETLPSEKFDAILQKKLPGATVTRISKASWQGFELDVFTMTVPTPKGNMVIHQVQVPLRRRAIQLGATGFESTETETLALLHQALAGLRGKSSWKETSTSGRGTTGKVKTPAEAIVEAAIRIVILALIVLWLVHRFIIQKRDPGGRDRRLPNRPALSDTSASRDFTDHHAPETDGIRRSFLGIFGLRRKRKPPVQQAMAPGVKVIPEVLDPEVRIVSDVSDDEPHSRVP